MPLEPGDFYYNAEGLMVFTAQYHLRRGYCCQSGCTHCPYGFRKDPKKTANDASASSAEAG
ncbi:DUF5522 domain-containing protein [Rufibacter quisquiliarum]|uniref:DUF5522 domain-containing protein n=2 Tax=Hymenobacteraceae TaxID=1853232 RepID=UPI0031B6371D